MTELKKFIITPSMTHDDILLSIEAGLGLHGFGEDQEIFVCDVNGQRFYDSDATTFNFNNVVDGEELLVGTKHNVRVRPSPRVEAVLYLEDDTGLLKKTVQDSSRGDLRAHISALLRNDAAVRKNIVRLVKPHRIITDKIETLEKASDRTPKRNYNVARSKAIMESNWYCDGITQEFPKKMLALMAILSEATPGHHDVPRDLIIDAKNERIADPRESSDIQEIDVKSAIHRLYRIARAIDSDWPETQARKKVYNKRKGKMAEEPDEDVEELADCLGEASLPDTMDVDDEDDGPVVQPGRRRGG
ncbi:hypothetical protein GMOD_00003683 [Pyrenophora seminiperda CCB06]|uniref:Uncharacterized protein n=1 Tax=Pyrenophora seminiperda CCB06 TaxID=1302712 RepID=A0A3M7MJN9_9PLEO|nr:hypothetical protein GMOD_00003683 [Pyrenophora seminiperda CCB06]